MRTIIGCFLALTILAATTSARDELDAGKLVGAYEIVSGESDGQKITSEELQETQVRITPDTIAAFNKDEERLYVSKYKLDASQDPCVIRMVQSGGPEGERTAEAVGLIKLEDDTVTLIYAVEGADAPKGFKTEEGTGQNLFVLKRIREP